MADRELITLIEGTPQLAALTASDVGVFKGALAGDDAAGPTLLDEAPTSSNPTLIPNKSDDDTGIGWNANNQLSAIIGGVQQMRWTSADTRFFAATLRGGNTPSALLKNATASSTNPTVIPNLSDLDTGVGWTAADILALIAGGVLAANATTTTFQIIGRLLRSSTDSITAGTTQTQAGATALTTDTNRITVCANLADVVGLPSAIVGSSCTIIHDGVQNAGVFPKTSGDSIDGAAADAVDPNALVAGTTRTYECLTATVWETAS